MHYDSWKLMTPEESGFNYFRGGKGRRGAMVQDYEKVCANCKAGIENHDPAAFMRLGFWWCCEECFTTFEARAEKSAATVALREPIDYEALVRDIVKLADEAKRVRRAEGDYLGAWNIAKEKVLLVFEITRASTRLPLHVFDRLVRVAQDMSVQQHRDAAADADE